MTVEQASEIISQLQIINQLLGQFIGVFYFVLGLLAICFLILIVYKILR